MNLYKTIISIASILVLASSCCKEENGGVLVNKPGWVSMQTNEVVENPAWEATENLTPFSSMVATIALDESFIPADMIDIGDIVAAFCNGECLGTTTANWSSAYGCRFYLYIQQPGDNAKDITIGYYSTKRKSVYYWPSRLRYATDSKEGTTAKPHILTAAGENGGCLYSVTTSLRLPDTFDLALDSHDELAIFSGDVCRTKVSASGRKLPGNNFEVVIPMRNLAEVFTIRYYSSRDDRIYASSEYTLDSSGKWSPDTSVIELK